MATEKTIPHKQQKIVWATGRKFNAGEAVVLTRKMLYVLFTLITALVGINTSAQVKNDAKNMPQIDYPHFDDYVAGLLRDSGQSGSLAYRCACSTSGEIHDSIKTPESLSSASSIHTLNLVTLDGKPVKVVTDKSGFVRIAAGNVQTDLLKTKLRRVIFRGVGNPRDALSQLLEQPEVKEYMQTHHMQLILATGGVVQAPSGNALNETLQDVTLSQALDRITQIFPGLWEYHECVAGQDVRNVFFWFYEFPHKPANYIIAPGGTNGKGGNE